MEDFLIWFGTQTIWGIALGAGAVCGSIYLVARIARRTVPIWLFVVVFLATLFALPAYRDYTWANRALSGADPGLTLLHEFRSGDLTQPWTWLKPPVTKLVFADRENLVRSPNGGIIGITIIKDMHEGEVAVVEFFDCLNERSAFVDKVTEFDAAGYPRNPRWSAFRDSTIYVSSFFCPK